MKYEDVKNAREEYGKHDFAYSMPAWISEENDSLMFDGPVRIKRIR